MQTLKRLTITALLFAAAAAAGSFTAPKTAEAGYRYQRYTSWTYYSPHRYYYSRYYYKPYVSYSGYRYHYCVHYPSRPRYVYYYNPYKRVYWGRFDLESKGYSLLAEQDRKGSLDAIPESAFPAPGPMPTIPESEGADRMDAPELASIPKGEPSK